MPYQFSKIAGIEDYGVTLFEVVPEQEESLALSRLAEYFAETGRLKEAAGVERELARFPSDLGALVARAQVTSARGDETGYRAVLELLKLRLSSRAERFLAWDRRVSLAIVLAREQQIEEALNQTQRCLAEVNAARLRSLSSGMLFNFQMLARALELQITDPETRALAQSLLEPELRQQLLAP